MVVYNEVTKDVKVVPLLRRTLDLMVGPLTYHLLFLVPKENNLQVFTRRIEVNQVYDPPSKDSSVASRIPHLVVFVPEEKKKRKKKL